MIPSPEQLSQVWIFYSPKPLSQQEPDSHRSRFDGLKNGLESPGCRWISVAFNGTKKEGNPNLSNAYELTGFPWNIKGGCAANPIGELPQACVPHPQLPRCPFYFPVPWLRTRASLLTEGAGIPLALGIDGATRHDMKRVGNTLDKLMAARPVVMPQGLCLDKG
jgi:hypothetical protein